MGLLPVERMWERVEIARQDSDTSLFLALLYQGEMIIKILGAGMIAAIEDDRERHRYRQLHRLVRTDGIGDWAFSVSDLLSGPASQYLTEKARVEQAELLSKSLPGSWQHEAVTLLHTCVCMIEPGFEKLPTKIDGKRWLDLFSVIRNKTRGHGAPTTELSGKLAPLLEESIRIFVGNFSLFNRPWAYLYRNLSGKYRVTKLTQPSSEFDTFKTRTGMASFQDGVYIHFGEPMRVDFIFSNVDATDFLFPNGSFTDKKFELLSYITNNKTEAESTPYLAPATLLPFSETQGIGMLEVQGKSFGNLPPTQEGYIHRLELERELSNVLLNKYRHPVITLVGRGGIGKTWLTLSVLHDIANQERFTAIVWFSARDIDLLPQGPKLVLPHVLTATDIAKEFARLTLPYPSSTKAKGFNNLEYLSSNMTDSQTIGPILFVFDNFETVQNPLELFTWIDTYIRLPNKVLITTRFREFKGDYPIEVFGMTEYESEELINTTAHTLGVYPLLTNEYRKELYQEASGHPYVMKVLLGELAKSGRVDKVERIVATIDDMLDALFERTFASLTPVAKRVFLTLCSWRSAIPLLALEAVLLRPINERMDVAKAADELSRSSFIEILESKDDGELFLTVPLVASVFGKKKLTTNPMKSAIEADLQLLHAFGPAQQSDINRGVTPRVERLFRYIAERVSSGRDKLESYEPMLEFLARKHPPAWLYLAKLYRENDFRDFEKAKESLKKYIESTPKEYLQQKTAWEELSILCQNTGDSIGEIHALVEIGQLPNAPFQEISNAVNRVNALLADQFDILDSDEKQIISDKLAQVMALRILEGDANDCSRLAWLFMRLKNYVKAKEMSELGLEIEPDNIHCRNLLSRISLH